MNIRAWLASPWTAVSIIIVGLGGVGVLLYGGDGERSESQTSSTPRSSETEDTGVPSDGSSPSPDASDPAPNKYRALVVCKRGVFRALTSSSGAQFPSVYAPKAVTCDGRTCHLETHVETGGLGERDFRCDVTLTSEGWSEPEITFQ